MRYIVTPAPGWYGDKTRVLSSHTSLQAALQAAGGHYAVYIGNERKGALWLAVYAQMRERAGMRMDTKCRT
jgi:hypothetical protein